MIKNGRHKLKVLVTEPEYFTPEFFAMIEKIADVTAERMSHDQLIERVKEFDVLVIRVETKIDKKVIGAARNLRCVVSATTGLSHIDVEELRQKDIPLFSLIGSHSIPTAEHALALLFATVRRIPWANTQMTQGNWRRWEYIGMELTGKTLGILGIGRIGTEVAKRASALGMKTIAFDPYVSSTEVKQRRAKKVGWEEFLKESDFFSLHAPLTFETKHLFTEKEFTKMKKTAVFVNTARGDIVEEEALIDALSRRLILAAAVDVYSEEPLPSSHRIRDYALTHDNLIITPHIAATTHEAIKRASLFSAEKIIEYFSDESF